MGRQELSCLPRENNMGHELLTVKNPTKTDLNYTYNSVNYVLKAGEEKQLPDDLARHAAKKLADRENNKTASSSVEKHTKLMEKYLGSSQSMGAVAEVPKSEPKLELEEKEVEGEPLE
jgi:hypothetical protein